MVCVLGVLFVFIVQSNYSKYTHDLSNIFCKQKNLVEVQFSTLFWQKCLKIKK